MTSTLFNSNIEATYNYGAAAGLHDGGDSGVVTAGTTIASFGSSSDGFRMMEYNQHLQVDGAIFSDSGDGIRVMDNDATIRVSEGGRVAGYGAINLAGSHSSIANGGLISGVSYGIGSTEADQSVVNSGTIVGDYGAIELWAGKSTIENSGVISSLKMGSAIVLALGDNYLNNSGTISAMGGGGVVAFSNAAGKTNLLHNTGLISSLGGNGGKAIGGSDGNEAILNSGKILGNIDLGYGDNLFDTRLGTALGKVTAGGGSDVLHGSALADNFSAGGGSDQLNGYDGDDLLVGGAGGDQLNGGSGTDTASYQDATAGVQAWLANADYNMGDADGDTYISVEALIGSTFADLLSGSSLANTLDGGAGVDTLSGGNGSDIYYVDSSLDKLIKLNGQGVDKVYSTAAAYTLSNYVERLYLEGAANSNGTGSAQANTIVGNAGNNQINGRGGNDVLKGGLGQDTFVFNTTPSASNWDKVLDFSVADDTIALDNKVFTKVGVDGALTAAAFWTGSAAHDGSDRIIYNPATGALLYDADGNGAGLAVKFATIGAGLGPTAADFLVI